MKRSYFLLFTVCCLLFSVLLWGCGAGPGAPGSSGSEDTGINIKSVSITSKSHDIDVCSITREEATILIEAAKLNELNVTSTSTIDPFPASVEECTITYKKAIEDPSSPTIESLTIFPNCTLISGSNTCNVTLIDGTRKQVFWNAVSGGRNNPAEYPTHYIAQYNCKYMTNYDKTGYFPIEYDIWLSAITVCGG